MKCKGCSHCRYAAGEACRSHVHSLALHRYGGLRLGLFGPIKRSLCTATGQHPRNASFAVKVAAGSISGGIAAAATNPTELIKTRLQVALALFMRMPGTRCA